MVGGGGIGVGTVDVPGRRGATDTDSGSDAVFVG